MKDTRVRCDFCKEALDYPALLDVSFTYRFNVGTSEKPMGYQFTEITGDFCDLDCLMGYMGQEARRANKGLPSAVYTPQDLFFRGSDTPVLKQQRFIMRL